MVQRRRTEVSSDDAVPGWVMFPVELLLDEGRDVLLYAEFLERLQRDTDSGFQSLHGLLRNPSVPPKEIARR
jgi:hypothetical protein